MAAIRSFWKVVASGAPPSRSPLPWPWFGPVEPLLCDLVSPRAALCRPPCPFLPPFEPRPRPLPEPLQVPPDFPEPLHVPPGFDPGLQEHCGLPQSLQ